MLKKMNNTDRPPSHKAGAEATSVHQTAPIASSPFVQRATAPPMQPAPVLELQPWVSFCWHVAPVRVSYLCGHTRVHYTRLHKGCSSEPHEKLVREISRLYVRSICSNWQGNMCCANGASVNTATNDTKIKDCIVRRRCNLSL